jgi:hypothetical protein
MRIPYKQFVKIQEEFEKNHLTGEVSKYVQGTGTSTEGIVEWEKTGVDFEKIEKEMRQNGKDPDQWCIVAHLRPGVAALPDELNFPKEYKGYNVYTRVSDDPQTARPAYPDQGE